MKKLDELTTFVVLDNITTFIINETLKMSDKEIMEETIEDLGSEQEVKKEIDRIKNSIFSINSKG